MSDTRNHIQDSRRERKLGQWKGAYQRYFAIAFAVASAVHLLVTLSYHVATREPEQQMTATVQTNDYDLIEPPIRFELKAPRLAKSFEVSKAPSYAQSLSPREIKFAPTQVTRVEQTTTTASEASSGKSGRAEGSIFYGAMTGGAGAEGSWGIPGGAQAFGRSLGVGGKLGWGEGQTAGVDFQPDLSEEVSNIRTGGSSGLANLRDELVSYENLSDRFEVLVEQDPRNKKKVTGILNFYQVRWRANKSEPFNSEEGWNVYPRALPTLVEYARESTDVKINLAGNIRLDDRQLMSIPVIVMMGMTAPILYTPQESQSLGKWLRAGGVLIIDDGYAQSFGAFNKSVRAMLKDALGYDAEIERIPNTHWMYRCWEDFDGPPPGLDNVGVSVSPAPQRITERYNYLEGIFLRGRLSVILSTKGYTHAWGQWRYVPPSQGGPLDNARQLHFGVNMLVYATTVKGGINDQNRARLASDSQRK